MTVLSVVGPTGAGKTALARALSLAAGASLYPEPAPINFESLAGTFSDYVNNMALPGHNPLALPFQRWIAGVSFEQYEQMKMSDGWSIWEVGPFGHFMYAMKLTAEGRMTPAEFGEYCAFFFSQLVKTLPPAVVFVCMVESVEQLEARIQTRYQGDPSRAAEANYPTRYLEDMILYWQTLLRYGVPLPVIELLGNFDRYDTPSIPIEGKQVPFLSIDSLLAQQPTLLAQVKRYLELLKQTNLVVVNGKHDWTTNNGGFKNPNGRAFVAKLLNSAV